MLTNFLIKIDSKKITKLMLLMPLLFNVACIIKNPALHQEATGKRLSVMVKDEEYKYIDRENLIEANAGGGSDSATKSTRGFFGLNIGRDVERTGVNRTVLFKQGEFAIDEQDFYRISMDRLGYRDILSFRNQAYRKQIIGVVLNSLAGLSVGVSVPMFVFGGISYQNDDEKNAIPLLVSGGASLLGGIIMYGFGQDNLYKGRNSMQKYPVLSIERAKAAANGYNKEIGLDDIDAENINSKMQDSKIQNLN